MMDVPAASVSDLPAAGDVPLGSRLCPYLLADAGWRAATPAGEHRCTAVSPPARLATEKQARLCLSSAHRECATYGAAIAARAERGLGPRAGSRHIARTAPIVVERARPLLPGTASTGRWSQVGLVVLMVAALVAVLLARTTEPGPGDAGSSGAPAASSVQATAVPPTPTDPAATPTPTLPLESVAATYTVRKGDTLSAIAARFGTTVAALQKANGLSTTKLAVGQILTIP